MADAAARILAVVATIPPGRVATYGQVAELAGLPRRARLVGRTLAGLPPGGPGAPVDAGPGSGSDEVPWHRVVAAGGRLALPAGSAARREQQRRLAAEGVVLRGDRVDLAACAFTPDVDALLWGPLLAGPDR